MAILIPIYVLPAAVVWAVLLSSRPLLLCLPAATHPPSLATLLQPRPCLLICSSTLSTTLPSDQRPDLLCPLRCLSASGFVCRFDLSSFNSPPICCGPLPDTLACPHQ
ncbi:hypothetical protein O6H91_02G037900 [Diphasiastrum complanatum]|uniref:Uncharacterized protein n=1 Tax=Diphasiastrum complanatum TaxID=34168 RepID=A0ACC2EEF9_DIPCM|nr:hypothetical protein O6H91_02G037900 [Diphasiastrum complanatum]